MISMIPRSADAAGAVRKRATRNWPHPYLQPVHVQADASLIGQVADVKIEKRTANSLHGTLLREKRD